MNKRAADNVVKWCELMYDSTKINLHPADRIAIGEHVKKYRQLSEVGDG